MNIKDYRKRNTKIVKLPSGLMVRLRPLRVYDMFSVGTVPMVLAQEKDETESARRSRVAKAVADDPAQYQKFSKALLVNCVTILKPDESSSGVKIVDKPVDETENSETEFSYREFSTEDVNFLISEINGLSGMTKEAAKTVSPFPEE